MNRAIIFSGYDAKIFHWREPFIKFVCKLKVDAEKIASSHVIN